MYIFQLGATKIVICKLRAVSESSLSWRSGRADKVLPRYVKQATFAVLRRWLYMFCTDVVRLCQVILTSGQCIVTNGEDQSPG